jgi:putative transposase
MVQEHRGEYPSLWAAIESIAAKIGCAPQTLLEWVKQAEIDEGVRKGVSTDESQRIKDLEREVKELRRANEILKLASAFFAQAELDRRHAARAKDPSLLSLRAQRDAALAPKIEAVWNANFQVYGADKVWKQLNREGVKVARCTVERLMKRMGLQGTKRGKVMRTTVADPKAPCPLDRVNRHFKADRPDQLWVSDFTYVSTWQGWLYVAFVIDVYARRIVGWRVSKSMHTDFVLDALEQALYARQPDRDRLIHHSDRGSQYVSIRYTERLAEAGIEPSVGSRGDSYDNALAETINGLYKAELIHRRAPWKTREAVEIATLNWVSWFNHHRLMEGLGYIPPAEAEANYYRQLTGQPASES